MNFSAPHRGGRQYPVLPCLCPWQKPQRQHPRKKLRNQRLRKGKEELKSEGMAARGEGKGQGRAAVPVNSATMTPSTPPDQKCPRCRLICQLLIWMNQNKVVFYNFKHYKSWKMNSETSFRPMCQVWWRVVKLYLSYRGSAKAEEEESGWFECWKADLARESSCCKSHHWPTQTSGLRTKHNSVQKEASQ